MCVFGGMYVSARAHLSVNIQSQESISHILLCISFFTCFFEPPFFLGPRMLVFGARLKAATFCSPQELEFLEGSLGYLTGTGMHICILMISGKDS